MKPLNLNMILIWINPKILDSLECIQTICLHLNFMFNLEWCLHLKFMFNLEWCLPNHYMDNQTEWIPNQFMDNQMEWIHTQIWHLLNMVILNPVLCHPNNTVNLELSTRICKDNNMEFQDLCHKVNLVILQYKINMHNNHHNIDFVEKRESKYKIYCDNVRNIVFDIQKAKHIIINKLT